MRIIYVTSSLPVGPKESFIVPEAEALRELGHHVRLVPMRPRGKVAQHGAMALSDPAGIEPLVSPRIVYSATKQILATPLQCLKALRTITGTQHLRHLAKNLAVVAKGFWLAEYARRWRADHIHVHWAATTATMGLVAHLLSGIPWSFTAHRWDIVENNLLDVKLESARFGRFISHSGLKMALKNVKAASRLDRSLVLPMGVALPPLLPQVGPTSGGRILLCPANLVPVKGHKHLLDACALLKQRSLSAELWLAGEGPLRAELELQVQQLGLGQSVRFLGHLPHSALLGLYGQNQVALTILPSLDLGNGEHEGVPVSLMEAMAYGVPVVATATGGIPELVSPASGILVEPGQPDRLADAIEQILSDSCLAIGLGAEGRKRIEDHFSVNAVARELASLFESSGH